MSRRRKRWSWSNGRRPNTVRVFEDRPDGPLYIGYYDPELGGTRKRSLKHRDRERAKNEAEELYDKLKNGDASGPTDRPVRLIDLVRIHERDVLPELRPAVQKMAKRRNEMWCAYLGAGFNVMMLGPKHWNAWKRDRRSGRIDAHGKIVENRDDRRPVGNRTLEQGLRHLRQLVNLGLKERTGRADDGEFLFLLDKDPARDIGDDTPKERNPRRPLYTDDEVEQLLGVEPVHPFVPDLVELCWETGRRIGAVTHLRYSDWKPDEGPDGKIVWRADADKLGKEWKVQVSVRAREILQRILRERPGIGETWIFPDTHDPERPLHPSRYEYWLTQTERLAGVEHVPRRGWHGLRRNWATSRKHLSTRDVENAGGWLPGSRALAKLYQQPDDESMYEVVNNRRPLRRAER